MQLILASRARGGAGAGLLATLAMISSEVVEITAVAAGLAAIRRRRARQAPDAGAETVILALAGRLALER